LLEEDEQSRQVRAALDTLSPRDQEVLLLWDGGLSYPEIAERTGLAVGAIGTTLARARKRLVQAHERQQHPEADVAHS
jgi:RNA polymerase sigma factor (sigma-70 family)